MTDTCDRPRSTSPASVRGTSVIKVNAVSAVNQQIRDDEVTPLLINRFLQRRRRRRHRVKYSLGGSDDETWLTAG